MLTTVDASSRIAAEVPQSDGLGGRPPGPSDEDLALGCDTIQRIAFFQDSEHWVCGLFRNENVSEFHECIVL